MVEKLNANFKIDREDKEFLQQLVISKTYKSLSEIYRMAISEFISKYTDRPTLMGINHRVERNTREVNKLHEENRTQNKRIHDLEEKINVQ